ncbi:helix-turn-helix transcriptional regulator [Bacillus sp. FJAT-45350]|uniref:helix-turn-helix transcriptional regulator n=1 Tax=Bacillus sp. FJAT-45350 TaxID=2011014 RepID=UPI000BB74E84|nr:response regulator transcription factor [Bacillus sp. FJAT-45350]
MLTKGDYEKVVNFMDEMIDPFDDFRIHALKTFETIFGFHHANFWLANDNLELVSPVRLNVDYRTMNDYLNGCSQWDYHVPTNISHKLAKQRVLRINDIIPFEKYEREPYYNEFMNKHGYYHQMVAYLINGGRLLGGIAFVRPKTDGAFTLNDVTSLEIVTRYLTRYMVNNIENKEEKDNLLLASLSVKELEVIELVKKGLSNKEISQRLFISINTVKKHLQNIYKKLNVSNRTSLCYIIGNN